MKKIVFGAIMLLTLTACGSHKVLDGKGMVNETQTVNAASNVQDISFMRKVNDNAVYSKNITSGIDLTIKAPGQNITVDGKLQMRRNEVIRIIIAPFGIMEVARLEFRPEGVIIVNRMEKEYVKATYSDLDFLKDNGLDFYSLQSLFWNQMFVPGKKELTDSDLREMKLTKGAANTQDITNTVGKLLFDWTATTNEALINKATITYGKGTAQASTMTMDYSNFVGMGSKRFPSKEVLSFESRMMSTGKVSLEVLMKRISNDENWDAAPSIPSKYTQVPAEKLLRRLVSM